MARFVKNITFYQLNCKVLGQQLQSQLQNSFSLFSIPITTMSQSEDQGATFSSPFNRNQFLDAISESTMSFLGGGAGNEEDEDVKPAATSVASMPSKSSPSNAADASHKFQLYGLEPVVQGAQCVLVKDFSKICGSLVGSQGRFCLNLRGNCAVGSHAKAGNPKFEPSSSNRFLALKTTGKGNSASCAPCLDLADISDAIIADLLNRSLSSTTEWQLEFNATLLDMEVRDIKNLTATSKKAPKMGKLDCNDVSGVFGAAQWLFLRDELSRKVSSLTLTSFKEEIRVKNMSESVDAATLLLSDHVESLSSSMEEIRRTMKEALRGLESTLPPVLETVNSLSSQAQSVWISIQNLEMSVGAAPSEEQIPSLWPAFSTFKDVSQKELAAVSSRVNGIEGIAQSASSGATHLNQGFQDLQEALKMVLADQNATIKRLEATIIAQPQLQNSSAFNPSAFSASLGVSTTPSTSNLMGTAVGVTPGAPDLQATIIRLTERIAKLETTKSGQPSSIGGQDVVVMGSHVFRDVGDASGWIGAFLGGNLLNIDFGVFVDPLSFLQRVFVSLTNAHSDLKEISIRTSLKMTPGEHMAMQALQVSLPKIFVGDISKDRIFTGLNNASGKSNSGRFKNMTSYKDWDDTDRRNGLKHQISSQIPNIRNAVLTDIDTSLRNYPEARALATTMLAKSITFIEHLCEFISNAYREINKSQSTSSNSWDLICYVISQIFVSTFDKARRSIGSGGGNPNERLAFGAHLLLSALRTVHVGSELEFVGLENHPLVSASYTKFILSNVNAGELKDLREAVTTVQTTCNSTQQTAESARKTADQAVTTAKKAQTTAIEAKSKAEAAMKVVKNG